MKPHINSDAYSLLYVETFKSSLFSKSVGKCEQAVIRNVFLESVGI